MQENLVPITLDELIPKDKIHKNDCENMIILQNFIHNTS